MFTKYKNFFCLLSLFLLTLSACSNEVLYQDLSERDVNEILVVLYQEGIAAEKVRVEGTQEVTYKVEVSKEDAQRARQILFENELPRNKSMSLEDSCQGDPLIPTPAYEKCKRLLAMKGEIINALKKIPGVIDADVVLNIPEPADLMDEVKDEKATAGAVIKAKKGEAFYDLREVHIQRFVANAVENLDPRDVTVFISYIEAPQEILAEGPKTPEEVMTTENGEAPQGASSPIATVAGLNLQEESVKRFKIYGAIFLILLLAMAVALVLNILKFTKMRQEIKVMKAQGLGEEQPPLLEGAPPAPQLEAANQPQEETPEV